MNGRHNDGFSAIWSTWFVDRLFIVDELARKQRAETSGEGSEGSIALPSRTDCDEADRTGTHVGKAIEKIDSGLQQMREKYAEDRLLRMRDK
jgi:hypothetical protein